MLEKIIKNPKLRNAAAVLTTLAYLSCFSGCGKNPLLSIINPQKIDVNTEQSGTNFSGDIISASVIPVQKGYQYVEAAVKNSNDPNFSAYERLTENNGKFTKYLSTSTYGNYEFKFRVVAPGNTTESNVNVPVYMNEDQSDAALEQAINEIGVNPLTVTKGDIKEYTMNIEHDGIGGRVVDASIDIRCRGAPNYLGTYTIDVQGSNSDIFRQSDKDTINYYGEGYLFIPAAMSKDEIKNKILEEKNTVSPNNWPQISGY